MMEKIRWRNVMILMALALLVQVFPGGTNLALAGAGVGASTDFAGNPIQVPTYYANSPAGIWTDWAGNVHDSGPGLRKFVDPLPLLCSSGTIPVVSGGNGTPLTNKCIPVAVPDKSKYPVVKDANGNIVSPASDYYEIGIVEYTEPMHADLPKATVLRGYVQLNDPANPVTKDANGKIIGWPQPHYLGPIIVAQRGTPVRVKYVNLLPTGHFDPQNPGAGRGGDLFLPVDRTLMGAGTGPLGGTELYTENRAEIHLHGGDNPWISDGTPHQWIVPAGETTSYTKGVSYYNVPDMPDPGDGAGTLYYPNGDSGRLMFYHDHAAGITRLNVYAGMAAGYLLRDPAEQALIGTVLPADEIPLVIQEKTFVPKDIAAQDAKWDQNAWGKPGDLWFPHVYETNQDPNSFDGTNPVGRWDWGPWFWPVFPSANPLPTGVYGDVTTTPEAFGDTPIINGAVYPTLTVDPKAYRFRILNATNDRFINLGLYRATSAVTTCTLGAGGTGYNAGLAGTIPVQFVGIGALDPTIPNAQAATGTATVAVGGTITSITLTGFGSGYVAAPTDIKDMSGNLVPGTGATATCSISGLTEVAMVPFDSTGVFPSSGGLTDTGWGTPVGMLFPAGVPSPATVGPSIIQIGTEGGIMPAPAVIPSTPINYEYNKRSVTVLNVLERGLFLGPAERADTIIDFSQFAGKTLILYNDAPAPLPAGDPRIDYFTGNGDQTASGGSASTLPGYGPNTRTIMQIKVNAAPAGVTPAAYNLAALNTALPILYQATQPKPVVPEAAYGPVFGQVWPNTYANIFTGTNYLGKYRPLTFVTPENITYKAATPTTTTPPTTTTTSLAGSTISAWVENKAIQELFDPIYGRMNATLGVELPFTTALNQTTIPLGYIDPATEKIADGETQFWKITHNGVDTHPVHFHLVNVQVLNRVGWDGTVKPPDATEIGWKETVKMNPLEDIVVAVRAKKPALPFGLPISNRYLDPTQPPDANMGFTQVDPATGNPATVTNIKADFGWEYVWHCHILGHEENDFMRPFVFNVVETPPAAPTNLAGTVSLAPLQVNLTWTDNSPNEIGFRIERAPVVNGVTGAFTAIGTALANGTAYTDTTVAAAKTYAYRVFAFNAVGDSAASNTAIVAVLSVTITTTSLPSGAVNTPYNQALVATGGNTPYTWSATGVPAGLTVNTAGVLSGTPTAPGTFTITATVVDATGSSATKSLTLVVASQLVITTTSLPAATVGSTYNRNINVSGGIKSYTWAISAGALPPGLNLNTATGNISGVPTTPGTFAFTIQVTDAVGTTATQNLSITVSVNPLIVTTNTLTAATVGTYYIQYVSASGGIKPYVWAISAGALPTGLTLNTSTGAISGTPTAPGTFTFTVQATDALSTVATKGLSITVGIAPLVVTTTSLPAATVGTAYNRTLTASGGVKPYTWAIIAGALPTGLTLNTSTGAISGTPTTPGTFAFTVQVTDTLATTATQNLSITASVAPLVITTTSLPAATVGTAYNRLLAATGGVKPFTWAVTAGALPTGLTLNATTGSISGIPTAPGTFSFTVQVTDSLGTAATQNLSITVGVAPLVVTTASLPAATVNTFYYQTLAASGGVKPYTWAIITGTLPTGMTFNTTTGVISGTPKTAGTSSFTVQVLDSLGTVASKALSITVN